MDNSVRFTSTKLSAGKTGTLAPDKDGFYTLIVGGLNIANSMGEYYRLDGAKKLFEDSSAFMRRVQAGRLTGEYGHPKRLPGQSNDSFINRCLNIYESETCCFIKEVWLDESYGKNNPQLGNPQLVAIMAKLIPDGPKGPALLASLKTPGRDVCFSIRSLTIDTWVRGQKQKVLETIVTFDYCGEPGLAIASKFSSPGLESLEEIIIRRSTIEEIVANNNNEYVSTESSRETAKGVLSIFERNDVKPPIYSKW